MNKRLVIIAAVLVAMLAIAAAVLHIQEANRELAENNRKAEAQREAREEAARQEYVQQQEQQRKQKEEQERALWATERDAHERLAKELALNFRGARWATSGPRGEILATSFRSQEDFANFFVAIGSNPNLMSARLQQQGFMLWCVSEPSIGLGCNFLTSDGLRKVDLDSLDAAVKGAVAVALKRAGAI